jgi:peptidoglycan/xylan/chitin deacetylase (PgdA/CDA1 family)
MNKNSWMTLLYYTGINFLTSIFLRRKIFVLNFHSISDEKNNSSSLYPDLTLASEIFEQRLQYLIKRGHTFIALKDIEQAMTSQISKPTVLYFDDGFKDNLTVVLPILQRYKIPATFFVAVGLIEHTHIQWTIMHREYLRRHGLTAQQIEEEITHVRHQASTSDLAKLAAKHQESGLTPESIGSEIYLDWSDVKQLAEAGMEIGSHAWSHMRLTEMGASEAREEIINSKKKIEDIIGHAVCSFSFPYARWNKELLSVVYDAGYQTVVSAGVGLNDLKTSEKHQYFLKNCLNRVSSSIISFKVGLYLGSFLRNLKS